MPKKVKILIVVNGLDYFLSHRLPVAIAASEKGYDVHVVSPERDNSILNEYDFTHHLIPFSRSGQNPLKEALTIIRLIILFYRTKPQIVHLVTIKPVLYGGIAARLAKIPAVVAAISGLGTAFLSGGALSQIRRKFLLVIYSQVFKHKNISVIFQNSEDQADLADTTRLKNQNIEMINGSGVQLDEYKFSEEPTRTPPVVVMASRLLKDKGVYEFVKASSILKKRGIEVDMRLIGSIDKENPTSISQRDLMEWQERKLVSVLGYRSDIAKQYEASNIVCLPSYREGMPRSLLEAASSGRAIVTTNVPGCRDTIIPDKTGVLVPMKDASALADAIIYLLKHREVRVKMGKAGRKLAEKKFDIRTVVKQHIKIYEKLLRTS